ncbi:FtsK/SpoIIIE domain-containing protein [Actinotalea sp. M2MS4P-6]|uniref:FtsK/SpoIIIE domain-containing protein n=1 Tax=Actinotalea sp. M2MS4P-6 TaxID=2983762 RepID=UPI0021E451A9|nr:FtsK/SpoIIIE domain-containing protein [Actinotalea sp. M2MS4P-6]MCV2395848.1 FtsK/SpoIIIE domain-containing protein [Actinotalea sp. M2MS4P-6]
MRFTLDPLGDVLVPDGIELAAARPGLVALTGVTSLAHAPLIVDHRTLDDHQVAGLAPWVEGCRVQVGAIRDPRRDTSRRPPSTTRSARWWTVLVDGPDAGRCTPLRPRHALAPERDARIVRLPRVRTPQPAPAAGPATPSWVWLVPVVGALVAALVLRTPTLALLGLSGLTPLAGRLVRPRRAVWAPEPAGCSARLAVDDRGAPGWLGAARDGLALVGDRAATLAAARTLLGSAVLDADLTVDLQLPAARASDWSWARWLGARVTTVAPDATSRRNGARHLLVADGAAPSALQRWWSARDGAGLLLVTDRPADVPAWCRHSVTPGPVDRRGPRLRPARPGVVGASTGWAEAHARTLAARDARGVTGLPRLVPLAGLPLEGPSAWTVPIGVGEGGPAWVDLIEDGPHVLVAGTTGSGKSELLQTLVLALARRHPPDRLALVLVDFKGGAGLGACRDLPHVAGTVTDLDPAATVRALAALRAELRRREGLIAEAGVPDLEALRARGPAPARLVVVVDELLALREDVPHAVPDLVRLATQGRALGIHLVLATQRPAGALDAQVRANVALRICLRVADVADSIDVLGSPDAASLPADVPGRALLRRAEATPVTVQTAWAALPPGDTAPRWAPGWPRPPRPSTPPDHIAALVRALAEASGGPGAATPPLWRPPLPDRVHLDEVASLLGAVPGDEPCAVPGDEQTSPLVLGVVDRVRRTDPLLWHPGRTVLGVVGGPGSGRTTALRTVAQGAANAGMVVHVLHGSAWRWPPMPAAGRGTTVGTDDPRRALRLLTLLAEPRPRDVLLVDDVASVRRALEALPRGVGADLADLLQRVQAPLACSGTPRDLRQVATELVTLVGGDRATGAHPGPGRGELDSAPCQVALPSPRADLRPTCAPPADPAAAPREPLRLAALPRALDRAPHVEIDRWHSVLGVGGDRGLPICVDLHRGLLVVGPAGSGRSTALSVLTARAGVPGVVVTCGPDGLADAVREVAEGSLLVVDDADLALRRRPELDDTLTGWIHAAEHGDPAAPRLVLAARTDRVAVAFRGALAALRDAGTVLVLDPLAQGSAEAAGTDLAPVCDPRRIPGRAALRTRGALAPVQLAAAP